MERGRGIKVMTILIAALALGAGLALRYRTGSQRTAPAVRAEAPALAPLSADSGPPPATPVAHSADSGAVAEVATAAGGDRVAVSDADQRQLAKITRGMSVAAGGGILVTETPPGSVTGQLRLRAGDVILAVNGEAISSPDEFARIYREQGLPRQVTIMRDGREIHRH